MIKNALRFIEQQLDQHLGLYFDLDESVVVTNSLLSVNGGEPKKNQNKMVVTMINLDHETNCQYSAMQRRISNEEVAQVNEPQHFNIDLLFTANFDDYQEALKFLGATIGFFQTNMSFSKHKNPTMPEGVVRLNFEVENANYMDTHNLWSAMGAKYQPSIIYKVRHITIDGQELNSRQTTVTSVSAQAS